MACCDAPCCAPPCCPVPLCGPPPVPICCMPCPPPLMLPTVPEPVKPLMMPVEKCEECAIKMAAAAKEKENNKNLEEGNFYNNYNVDYRAEARWKHLIPVRKSLLDERNKAITLSSPPECCCAGTSYGGKIKQETDADSETENKPLMFLMTPLSDLSGAWTMEIKPCPTSKPGNKTNKNKNEIAPCTKPCCKHWKPKEGECLYDLPCKAACFNHPPGMKPKYHVPKIDYELLKIIGDCVYGNKSNDPKQQNGNGK